MKSNIQKINTNEMKQTKAFICVLVFMLFQLAVYMLQQVTASEILKRVFVSFNVMVDIGIFLGVVTYLVIKRQK